MSCSCCNNCVYNFYFGIILYNALMFRFYHELLEGSQGVLQPQGILLHGSGAAVGQSYYHFQQKLELASDQILYYFLPVVTSIPI